MVSLTTVDEGAVCTEMLDLYQNEGIIAEPAGALSVAGLLGSRHRAGIDGGVPDLRRQQRRLPVRRGPRAVAGAPGPQALLPGRLPAGAGRAAPVPRRGARPDDDITLFEYVKRNNRETGPALVGIELCSAVTWKVYWTGCGASEFTSRPSSPARRRTATCSNEGLPPRFLRRRPPERGGCRM